MTPTQQGEVSKGIVAAICKPGRRFLEYNKESNKYHDMGDKKATRKTSQALREGLKKIQQQIYFNLEVGRYQSIFDTDLLGSLNITLAPLPAKRYFECSVQMLQSLCDKKFEDNALPKV
jgi:muconolactone delta-isomerase